MSSVWARVFLLLCVVVVSCSGLRSDLITSPIIESDAPSSEEDHSIWEYLRKATSLPAAWGSFLRSAAAAMAELESCEEVYGFFPCSTTFGGNLFLLAMYAYMLLMGARFLSSGSELLLTVLNPGIVGGLLLPILGALPDSFLILISGLSASAAEAQSEVLVGMGLLAGSNIMLLTALWGGCLLVGRCDLVVQSGGVLVAKNKTLTKGWSLTGTGVTTDQQTRVASWIMILTVLPYLVAQIPVIFGWSKEVGSIFVLVSCAISVTGLACYCTYQVAFPWIQERWIYKAKKKVLRSTALHRFSMLSAEKSWGSLLMSDGVTPNREVLGRIFVYFDQDGNDYLCEGDLRGLITALGIEHEGKIPNEKEIKAWMMDFDISHDGKISREEFVEGMVRWMRGFVDQSKVPKRSPSTIRRIEAEAAGHIASNGIAESGPHLFWRAHTDQAQSSLTALLQDRDDDDVADDEAEVAPPTKSQVIARAVAYLIIGALVAGIVADPLVDAIGNFSAVTGISPFFISFVATPLAIGSSEAISSLVFAMSRKKKNISMTYSQIYGGVTMNNTLCLAIFLAIVYTRGLVWDFSSEVLVILVATVVIGALAAVRVTFPSWMAIVALLLYPFSIALVAVLDYGYGWQ